MPIVYGEYEPSRGWAVFGSIIMLHADVTFRVERDRHFEIYLRLNTSQTTGAG